MMTSRVGTGLGGWLLPFVLGATAGAVDVMRGPFADANSPMAVLVGMLAVAAMATQNAVTKLALQGFVADSARSRCR